MQRFNRPRGFSLVELLVVLGVIVILIAMLLPALQGARQDAVRLQCANNLRHIGMGLQMYDQVYKRLPGGSYKILFELAPPNEGVLTTTVEGPDFRECLISNKSSTPETFLCLRQERDGQTDGANSYTMNHNYRGLPLSKGRPGVVLAFESSTLTAPDPATAEDSEAAVATRGLAYRHRLKANWLFFDGHVDLLTEREATGLNSEGWGTPPP